MYTRRSRRIVLGLTVAVLLMVLAIGQGQEEGSPLGVLPTPPQPGGLWIKLELPDGRSAYAVGEKVRLSFTTNQQAYVYIFNIPPSLQVFNIFPNEYTGLKNPLPAGTYILPDNEQYSLMVTEAGGLGQEFFGAIASIQPLPLLEAQARVLGAVLGQSPQAFQGSTVSEVQSVVPTPNQDALKNFHIAVISIQTFRAGSPLPQQASLVIKSTPPALLLIDGQELGFTLPNEFRKVPVSAGVHLMELRREGYQPFSQAIHLEAGGERIFDVTLNRLPLPQFRFRPSRPQVGEPVVFNAAESEDLDGRIVKYEWDFESDGQIDGTHFMIEHIFDRPGTYNVTLIVTDDKEAKNQLTKAVKVGF
jgi:hypothetical protein